jgi:hypothetical protein
LLLPNSGLKVFRIASPPFAENREICWLSVLVAWGSQTARFHMLRDTLIRPAKLDGAEASYSLLFDRERLLAQAKITKDFEDPVAQRDIVYKLVRTSFDFGSCLPAEEILDAAYGDPQGQKYWELWLFEPLQIYPFAELLALHKVGPEIRVLDNYFSQIFRSLRAAAEARETWLIGDVSPLRTEHWASGTLRGSALTVRPAEAIAWMCQNPNARHLVPTTPARIAGGLLKAEIEEEQRRKSPSERKKQLKKAVFKRLKAGERPGSTVQNKPFYKSIREDCRAWDHLGKLKTGYGDRTIADIVREWDAAVQKTDK